MFSDDRLVCAKCLMLKAVCRCLRRRLWRCSQVASRSYEMQKHIQSAMWQCHSQNPFYQMNNETMQVVIGEVLSEIVALTVKEVGFNEKDSENVVIPQLHKHQVLSFEFLKH